MARSSSSALRKQHGERRARGSHGSLVVVGTAAEVMLAGALAPC